MLAVMRAAGFKGEICLEYGVNGTVVNVRDGSVAVRGIRVSVDERKGEYARDQPGGDRTAQQ